MFTEFVNELKDLVAKGEMHVNSALDLLHQKINELFADIPGEMQSPLPPTAAPAAPPEEPENHEE